MVIMTARELIKVSQLFAFEVDNSYLAYVANKMSLN